MGEFTTKPPKPKKPPAPADTMKAELQALAYADIERRIRRTSGRSGSFMRPPSTGGRSLLGS